MHLIGIEEQADLLHISGQGDTQACLCSASLVVWLYRLVTMRAAPACVAHALRITSCASLASTCSGPCEHIVYTDLVTTTGVAIFVYGSSLC